MRVGVGILLGLRLSGQYDPAAQHLQVRRCRIVPARVFDRRVRPATGGDQMHLLTVVAKNRSNRRAEQALGTRHDRLEHRSHVGR